MKIVWCALIRAADCNLHRREVFSLGVSKIVKSVVKSLKKPKTVKTTSNRQSKVARKAEEDNRAKRASKKSTEAKKKQPVKKNPPKTLEEIGAEGEQHVYEMLVRVFGADSVFKNVYVRRASGRLTEIDILAVHSTGVYVGESKNYGGVVMGDGRAKDWLQVKGNDYRRQFYSPVAQNARHVEALREACQYHLGYVPPMLSLLVFPDQCDLQITHLPPGLRCCRLSQLPTLLNGVFNSVAPALHPQQVQTLRTLFYQSQRSVVPPSVREQHMRDVEAAKQWANSR